MSRLPVDRYLAAGALRARPLVGYGLAFGSAAAGLAVRLLLAGSFPPGFPFLTFFPAILVTTYLAGVGPGIACTTVAFLAAWYFLIPPTYSMALEPGSVVPLLVFLGVAVIDMVLVAAMQRALDRLSAERALTARLYDQQRTLFEELQHRVANNMAFVSGLLRLQKRRIADNPADAAAVFDEAVTRIDTMSRVHRRLYDPAAANQALAAHLQSMCDELLSATGKPGVTCRVEIPDLDLELDRLLPLSLLVAELVTNSVKHGFAGRSDGRISVTLETDIGGGRALVVRDNGIGLPADHDPGQVTAAGNGLGMRIIEGLAAQIGGRISMASDGGMVTRVHLPA